MENFLIVPNLKDNSSKQQKLLARKRYTRAPIIEAVIDIQVQLPKTFSIEHLEHLTWGTPGEYSGTSPMLQANIALTENSTAFTAHTNLGFRSFSADKKWIIQARHDGFSLSRLAPYNAWEVFIQEARRFWPIYTSIAKPIGITRIAVRYINKLDLPLPITDFGDYLATVPTFAPTFGKGVNRFVIQVQVPQDSIPGGTLILNEGIIEATDVNTVSVLLDIDLQQQISLSVDDDTLWEHLELLHVRKNEIFEASITDKTRELISS